MGCLHVCRGVAPCLHGVSIPSWIMVARPLTWYEAQCHGRCIASVSRLRSTMGIVRWAWAGWAARSQHGCSWLKLVTLVRQLTPSRASDSRARLYQNADVVFYAGLTTSIVPVEICSSNGRLMTSGCHRCGLATSPSFSLVPCPA